MKIPAEFEDIFRGVELTEREALFLSWITSWDDYTIQNMRTVLEKVRSTLSKLQAENETLRAELKSKVDLVFQQAKELDRRHLLLQEQEAELEQVKREQCRIPKGYALVKLELLEELDNFRDLGPIDRLRELAQADKEGRCVVLPFKPPRWVYMCSARFPKPAKAHYASAINVLQDMDNGCVFGDTPKEAEAALRREQEKEKEDEHETS